MNYIKWVITVGAAKGQLVFAEEKSVEKEGEKRACCTNCIHLSLYLDLYDFQMPIQISTQILTCTSSGGFSAASTSKAEERGTL